MGAAITFTKGRTMTRTRPYIGLVFALAASTAIAGEISLFETENYGGRRFNTRAAMEDLYGSGVGGNIGSVIVRQGSWELCNVPQFQGRCITLSEGNYPSLAVYGFQGHVASVHEVAPPPVPPVVAHPAPPPPPAPSRVRIVLYDGFNFAGQSLTLDQLEDNFERLGFNDRARSAIVYGTSWELCLDEQFRGPCQVYPPGRHASLGGGLDGEVSSARPLAPPPPPPPVAAAPAPPGGAGNPRIVLYDEPNFGGNAYPVDSTALHNLDGTGFNDRTASIRVLHGWWMFCSDAEFAGECRTFGPGDYAYLPIELDHKISSGRRI